ncbi:hypothetical protein FDP41_006400 [Naegleria fowleri]|uniref:SUEL-type lectin domain-containing protein n=1 Tax=Naegleria fowleri TaxID=5763 RepID=A0A6A5BJS8_NAEFO|nr:uncharacterized protein FDP41_006400 [Naegleria fowleri]KAF0974368.1 hypothetical protein FDP41_006400 [Naegleria fowleri]
MKLSLFLVVALSTTLLLALFTRDSLQQQYQMRSLYQGTTCSGAPFRVVTQKITSQCNATDSCTKYTAEPSVLSYTQSCPTAFPNQANVKGEIYINTYSDASCSAASLSSYEVYLINTCMTSNVIFGPNAKSAKYVNCEKLVLYEDDQCQTVSAEDPVVLNTCNTQKKTYRCGAAADKISSSLVVLVVLMILGLFMM